VFKMLWSILKKDLRRQKTMNLILFAFVVLCSMILAGSTASIGTIYNAIHSFFELSNVADQNYVTAYQFDEEFENWLRNSPYVASYEKSVHIQPDKYDITVNGKELNLGTAFLNFAVPGCEYSLMFDENDKVVSHVAVGEMAMSAERAKKLVSNRINSNMYCH